MPKGQLAIQNTERGNIQKDECDGEDRKASAKLFRTLHANN